MSTPRDSNPSEFDSDGFVIPPAGSQPPAQTPVPDTAADRATDRTRPVARPEPTTVTPAPSDGETAESEFDDPRRPLLRALKFGSVALLIVTVISLIGWGAAADLAGIWGVVIGAAIGGGFVLLTVVSVLATSRTDPITTAVVVMAGWLIKIVIMLLVLWVLSGMTFYDTWALAVTIIVSLVIVLVTETWGVVTSRVTYVS